MAGSTKRQDCVHSRRLSNTLWVGSSSCMVHGTEWRARRGVARQSARLSPTRTLARAFRPLYKVPAASRLPRRIAGNHQVPHHHHVSLPSPTMPPRKRAKASAASTPLGDTQPQTPQDSGAAQSHDAQLNESWADEQETQLFKSMIKWKPTGEWLGLLRHSRLTA